MIENITKLDDDYAVGFVDREKLLVFGYIEDADGIRQNPRQGSVSLTFAALVELYRFLDMSEVAEAAEVSR